ncbi:cathepsin O isoform X3 [Falco naumanni]|uniref:cathepsin O isoform X3 n=1 Tax=Falco naumanni TaxID=148594 RepID=UPI001ADEAF1E|nr:cathepsin O isoform X3 [Falco naumanni]
MTGRSGAGRRPGSRQGAVLAARRGMAGSGAGPRLPLRVLALLCCLLRAGTCALLPPAGTRPGEEGGGSQGRPPWDGSGREKEAAAALRESAKRIRLLNSSSKDNTTAFYGINQFSHLFPEEFKAIYLRSIPRKLPRYVKLPKGEEKPLPKKFDWRDKKVIAEVRNQQTTKVKLVRDSEYTFKAQTGLCHYFGHSDFGVSITGFAAYDFSGQEEEMMRMLVNWGPLAVTVDAVSWQDYLGGIIQYHCSSGRANHAVLITGFDRTGSIPYWIVQNSWGPTWGIDGYVRVKIGGNICGIADTVSSVFV